ncbi:MAG: rod shape-determining protein MreC [Filomicrobium sp.]
MRPSVLDGMRYWYMSLWAPKRRLLGRARRQQQTRHRLLMGATGLLLCGGVLIAADQLYPAEVADARTRLAGPVSAILNTLQVPVAWLHGIGKHYQNLVGLEDELKALRAENKELRAWKWRAIDLERRLADLSKLNRVVGKAEFGIVSSELRSRSLGRMNRTALVGAGQASGVQASAAVINAQGVVGVTYEVGHRTSRVRYITDPKSQHLVSIGPRRVLAMALGDGSRYLSLQVDDVTYDFAIGDEVITAGETNRLPRGLRIGRIVQKRDGLRIEPYVDFNRLEFVSILVPDDSDTPSSPAARAKTNNSLTASYSGDRPLITATGGKAKTSPESTARNIDAATPSKARVP